MKKTVKPLISLVLFTTVGTVMLIATRAATPAVTVEGEAATRNTCSSKVIDATASGGAAIIFDRKGVTPANGFVHPGVLLDPCQLNFVKQKVAANTDPWKAAYTRASSATRANTGWTPHPVAIIDCTNNNTGCTSEKDDAIAAYTQAILWYYSRDDAHAQATIRILNAWSTTYQGASVPDSANTYQATLNNAWTMPVFARAAEIIRYLYQTPQGETALNVAAVTSMFSKVLPLMVETSPAAYASNGNWALSMVEAKMSMAVFNEDHTSFDDAVSMWKHRVPAYIYETTDNGGNGQPIAPPGNYYNTSQKLLCFWSVSPYNANCTPPAGFAYVKGMGQETCRDMGHTMLGFEAMVNAAETARIQGVDLYSLEKQRIVDGYEFNAKILNEALDNLQSDGQHGTVSDTRVCGGTIDTVNVVNGGWYLGWIIAYNQYANRLGVPMPYTQAIITRAYNSTGSLASYWGLHMIYESLANQGTP
jgi:hypothetical protein